MRTEEKSSYFDPPRSYLGKIVQWYLAKSAKNTTYHLKGTNRVNFSFLS